MIYRALLNKKIDDSECFNIYCDNTEENKVYDITKLAFPNKVEKINNYFKYVYNDKFSIYEYEIEKILLEHEEVINAYGWYNTKKLNELNRKNIIFLKDNDEFIF